MNKKEYLIYKKNLNRRIRLFKKSYLNSNDNKRREIGEKEIARINHLIKDLILTHKDKKR